MYEKESMQILQTIDTQLDQSLKPAPHGLLEIDASIFKGSFNRRPFIIRHRLAVHPLFNLTRLVELARSLPAEDVEYNAGNIPINQDPDLTPRTGLSIEETIYRIEQCRSWMALKRVERDPEYRDLLDQCLDEIQALSESQS